MPDANYRWKRVFFAIMLPEEHKIELGRWQNNLFGTTSPKSLRWVPKEKLHFTLQFIAHLPSEKLLDLTQAVSSQLSTLKAFELQTSLTTFLFPSSKNPRCLILKLTPEEPLAAISEAIGQAMQEMNLIPEKRRFKPHLTLARFEEAPVGFPILQLPHPLQFKVTEVVLYQSQTHSDGAIYTVLERFPLLPA